MFAGRTELSWIERCPPEGKRTTFESSQGPPKERGEGLCSPRTLALGASCPKVPAHDAQNDPLPPDVAKLTLKSVTELESLFAA